MRSIVIISFALITPTMFICSQEDERVIETSMSQAPADEAAVDETVADEVSSSDEAEQQQASQQESEPQQEPEEEQPVGIDTVSLEDPQGNWLFKRIWWERAEDRYGKIRDNVHSIWESRTTFFTQRNELDKKVLDPFYLALGMGQGELQTILNELDEFFTKARERQGDLNEQERTLYQTLETEQESLKQLKADVESIATLDQSVDEALGTLMDQINKARQLEKQAWDNFKEIAHVLSDLKAREIYYMMDGASRNIKDISFYLEKDFAHHFSRLIGEVKKHTARILDQIKSLKEKGVDFKRQVDRLAQQEEQEKQMKAAQEEEKEDEAEARAAKAKKQGWGSWIVSLPGIVWDYIVSVIRIPYDMIFGGEK